MFAAQHLGASTQRQATMGDYHSVIIEPGTRPSTLAGRADHHGAIPAIESHKWLPSHEMWQLLQCDN
jgi:hypothetical protein